MGNEWSFYPCRQGRIGEAFAIPEAYTDWREMFDQAELDTVVVSTPNPPSEHTLAALERD